MTAPPHDIEVLGRAAGYLVDESSDDVLERLPERHPEAGPALVRYLEHRFVDLEPQEHPIESGEEWWAILEIIASTWSEPDKAACLDRIGLKAGHPEAYRRLAPIFRAAFPAADMEAQVFAGLDSADPATRENASTLAYFLFDGSDDYALSPEGKRRLRGLHG